MPTHRSLPQNNLLYILRTNFFEQIASATMGLPISPVIANLYMEQFEKWAIATCRTATKLWIRYVDDTFVIWPHGEGSLNEFQDHLNNQHGSIQFTKEVEEDGKIGFLDVSVKRNKGEFITKVYCKPTHTDLHTHYTSHHHPSVKSGTVKCLVKRAEIVCDDITIKEELSYLRETVTVLYSVDN